MRLQERLKSKVKTAINQAAKAQEMQFKAREQKTFKEGFKAKLDPEISKKEE
ncbi:hypothetical protein ACYULU_02085 [Breznakiellaceae bacterium SP9]